MNYVRVSEYRGEILNLDKIQVFYEDVDPNSMVFGVQSIPQTISIGKHAIFINPSEEFVMNANGDMNRLKITTSVKAEIIDKAGNRVFFDYPWKPPTGFEVVDGVRYPLPRDNDFLHGYVAQGVPEPGVLCLLMGLAVPSAMLRVRRHRK